MKTYVVKQEETLVWTYEVEASSEEEAIEKIESGLFDTLDRNSSQTGPYIVNTK